MKSLLGVLALAVVLTLAHGDAQARGRHGCGGGGCGASCTSSGCGGFGGCQTCGVGGHAGYLGAYQGAYMTAGPMMMTYTTAYGTPIIAPITESSYTSTEIQPAQTRTAAPQRFKPGTVLIVDDEGNLRPYNPRQERNRRDE